jgi:hypothetical protein
MSEVKVSVGLETTAFETGFARLQNSAARFKNELMAGLAGVLGLERLAAGFEGAISKASRLVDISKRFGIPSDELQRMANAAQLSGVDMETLARSMQLMEVNAQKAFNGTGEEAEKLREEFKSIGISGNDLVSMTPTDKLMKFAEALHQGALAGKDFALAKDLMSRGGPGMLAFLGQGAESIREEANSMKTFSNETAGALKGIEDQLIRIKENFVNTFGEIGAKFGTPMLRVFRQLQAAGEELGAMLYEVFSGNFSDIKNAPARLKNAFINQGSIFDSEMAISAKPINRAMPDDSSMPASIKSGDNKMVILADALQKVGGGGNFARIGGQDYNRDIYGGLLSGKFKVKAEIIDGMAGFGATKGVQ